MESVSFATALEVRNLILDAEREQLNAKKRNEQSQLELYHALISRLSTVEFFNPLLTSVSKEIVGRFSATTRLSIHAVFITPGGYVDTPGYFQIKFLSCGLPNCTPEYDQSFCHSAIAAVTPYVQRYVRTLFEGNGFKVWWTPTHFCFQDANEYYLVQDAFILSSLYKDVAPQTIERERVHSSCLTRLDLTKLSVDDHDS